MTARIAITAFALACLVGLNGCGFQLRGTEKLPEGFSDVYIKTRSTALRNAMIATLSSSGVSRVEAANDAQVVILVDREDLEQRLLSVDPNTGKAREFEVSFAAYFTVRQGGETLLPRQQVRIVRDYVFDGDAVIGKSRERGVLQAEMRRDAVHQIFNRIRAAYRARQAT